MAVKIEYSTVANCQPEHVWKIFSDTARWREWNSFISNVQWISGEPWQPGSQLLLELAQPQFKLKAAVKESAAPNRLVWTGSAMGVAVNHFFEFTPQAGNGTLMKTWVELSGAAVFFLNEDMKKKGVGIFSKWFELLKSEAEKVAAAA
jgi:hypothetical protein